MTHLQYLVVIKWATEWKLFQLCLEHGKQNINMSYFINYLTGWLQQSNEVIEKKKTNTA